PQNVLRDVVEPGGEARPRTVTIAVAVEAQEDVLGEIFGALAVAEAVEEAVEDAGPVQAGQAIEGRGLAALDGEHQLDFGITAGTAGAAGTSRPCSGDRSWHQE